MPLKPVLALQDCYPSMNGIVGRERGHDWVGFAADFPASLLNRNEEDARLFPTVSFQQEWKYSLWPLISLISTIGTLISNNWILIVPFRLILIKSLNWHTIYKTVLNSWIVQFDPWLILFNFALFELISIKSLNYNTVYKTVLNFWIVQFSP